MIIFGAGVVGEATLHACRAKGIEVECFVDDRIKGSLLGVPIKKTSEIKKGAFYLTSPNILDMIGPVWGMGGSWKSCSEVLKDFDISGIDFLSINGNNESSKYTTEHVKYLIRTVLHHHDDYLNPEKLSIQNVDLIVTERCSMKCKDCANLMQYYENPENADLNEMVQTIDSLCEKADEVYEVRVIGGEPFMNKDVHLIVEKLTSKENISKVSIFTNATIVPRDPQWEALSHPKVRFFITDYDELSRNLQKLLPALEERKIPYVSEKANGWTDSAALDRHGRTQEENASIFASCCAKNLATLHDGFLYRCPFSANADKLKAIPDYFEDRIVVRTATRDEIRSFLRDKTSIQACDHCNGRSYDAPVIQPAIQTKKPLTYFKYGSKSLAN